jgi:hypothetical protein
MHIQKGMINQDALSHRNFPSSAIIMRQPHVWSDTAQSP